MCDSSAAILCGTRVSVMALVVVASGGALSASLYDAVDPFVGSAGLGHVTPAACAPFGSVQAGPDTSAKPEKMVCDWAHCSGYQHGDVWMWRFSQTHLSGTGCPSLGDIAILPYVKGFDGESKPVRMLKDTEKAKPGRYSVTVDAGGSHISCEIAALGHSALYRFTFPKGAEPRLLMDLDWGIGERWKGDSRETLWNGCWGRKIISCTNEFRSAACAVGGRRIFNWTEYGIFYAAEFFSPSVAARKVRSADGMQGDVYALDFGRVPDDVLEVRIGISFTSAEAALSNLRSETKGLSFDAALAKGESLWRDALGCVELGGDCPREAAVNFASALYRTMVQPNTISDVGKPERYSTLSMWDTFRAAHPLYTIVAPERVDGFVNSMLDQFDRLGYLPIWGLTGGDTHCMVGHHSVPVIVDAWLKGFRGFDSERAWKAVENSLRVNHKAENVGTWGLLKEDWDVLDEFGYYPFDRLTGSWGDKKVMGESVSRTLECSYDDACASRFAKALGKKQEAEFFFRRSHSWTNLFDRSLMLMRGKDSQRRWREPFDPFENGWGAFSNNDLTEGNAWQYTWHVLQDPAGLVRMFGGRESFARRLDMLFRQKEVSYGHETPDVTGLIGQYAHGNEPSHHVAYLYQYAGRPERTAEVVREVFDKFYLAKPDGLSGNDDCGQMSAWHVFSAMGFYPLDPCGGDYVLGAPQLPKMVLKLGRAVSTKPPKTFTIIAKNLSRENKYVKSVTLNGMPVASCKIRHSDIIAGGELVFEMTDEIPERIYSCAVSRETMQAVYDEVKTPHKVGMVLAPEKGEMLDNPMVFRHGDAWYMMFIRFDGKGYETHLAKSADLLNWTRLGCVFMRGEKGEWDSAQADGWPALVDTRWEGPNTLNTFDGRYWMMYLGGSNDGYEADPLSTGVAWTDDPSAVRQWTRYGGNPVLRSSDVDARDFERVTIFKHFTVEDKTRSCGGRFVNFYNAKSRTARREAIGMAVSDDMLHWRRKGDSPVIDNGDPDKYALSGDPMIRRIGDLWVMFYFGYKWKEGVTGAFDTFACSKDLRNWTKWDGEALVRPSEPYDREHAHKPWVLKHDGAVYHFYCAVGDRGRGMALATSAAVLPAIGFDEAEVAPQL